jgi:hypothetical protein
MELENLNDSRVEKALIFLSRTDQEHAELSGEVKRCEEAIKQAKAHAFLLSSGTVAERDAQAIDSLTHKNAVDEWVENYKQFKIFKLRLTSLLLTGQYNFKNQLKRYENQGIIG